uniref:Uncharacterized protein n=1 Tax=Arundo donax TaxID=35708 RepID=A0A0A9FUB2_ARUDO
MTEIAGKFDRRSFGSIDIPTVRGRTK